MITKEEICKRIESIHPKMGVCGLDFDVQYDDKANAWAVDFHQGKQHLRTFIETADVASCMEEDKCLSLALQIGQLRANFEKYINEHALKKTN